MAEAYVQDLCTQLNDLGTLAGKSACVRTRSGKVQIDHSLTGMVWRKLVNTEDESRATTDSGIETLLSTVNDYVASTLKMPPIVRNVIVVVSAPAKEGKVLSSSSSAAAAASATQGDATERSNGNGNNNNQNSINSAVERAQARYFNECTAQTIAGLKTLATATRNACKGIADLLSRRYCHDYEIVPLLLDKINFATLIATRIDEATAAPSMTAQ